jgi:acyl-CoA synthetase (AMP-forming)/AMP-acid ligase II
VLENVQRVGDKFFRTGDLLTMDEEGYFYFRDRVGDTFRWRGENVATTEVERAVAAALSPDCHVIVYGVEVPGEDGRVGMCAVFSESGKLPAGAFGDGHCGGCSHGSVVVDFVSLRKHVNGSLPAFARPAFVRLLESPVEMTGTFKVKKSTLRSEGWQCPGCFVVNSAGSSYEPLSESLERALQQRQLRL